MRPYEKHIQPRCVSFLTSPFFTWRTRQVGCPKSLLLYELSRSRETRSPPETEICPRRWPALHMRTDYLMRVLNFWVFCWLLGFIQSFPMSRILKSSSKMPTQLDISIIEVKSKVRKKCKYAKSLISFLWKLRLFSSISSPTFDLLTVRCRV